MGRGQRLRDLGAGAEAGIDQPFGPQSIKSLLVQIGPLRLHDRFAVPCEAEPLQVLVNALDELGSAAPWVEILDPEQELAAAGARMGVAYRRRESMAEMEPSRGRWCKTCDLQDSLHAKGACGDS